MEIIFFLIKKCDPKKKVSVISKEYNGFIELLWLKFCMNNSLDNLLVPSLRKIIEENLGRKTLIKIEQRLVERHGIGLAESIKEFYKFDSVLREFFGAGADGLETKFLNRIVDVERTPANKSEWITIHDQELAKIFLESFGDPDKKCIMNRVLDTSQIVSDILQGCKIAQTSGYRTINALIKSGLLVPNGKAVTSDGKKVTKYETLFQNVNIEIEKNSVRVRVQIKKKSLENSSILQVIKV